MTSLFSFLREPDNAAAATAPLDASPDPGFTAETAQPAALTIHRGKPTPATILDEIRDALVDVLPGAAGPLPEPNLSFTAVEAKPAGLGSHIGQERLSDFAFALKGGRVAAGLRFQLWGDAPNAVDGAMDALHAALLAARDDLRAKGFLRITAVQSPAAEHVPSLSAWRRTADYRVLYEYRYIDADEAHSLIARIPVHADPEVRHSPDRETAVLTDHMVRWDEQSAVVLALRGRLTVDRLSVLAFVPGPAPSGPVRLLRTHVDAAGAPVEFVDLGAFVTAVGDPIAPERHARITFESVADFLAEFTITSDPITLGDWDDDATPDSYEPGTLAFAPPIVLPSRDDQLTLLYQPDSPDPAFDQVAVVYLRAGQL